MNSSGSDPRIPIRGSFPFVRWSHVYTVSPSCLSPLPSLYLSLSLSRTARVYLAVFHSANLNWLFHRRHTSTWYHGYAKNQLCRIVGIRRVGDALGLRVFFAGILNDTGDGWMMHRVMYVSACTSQNSIIESVVNRDRDSADCAISKDLSLFVST